MANKTNTIQELNLADSFLFGKVEFPVTKKITDIAPDSGDIRLDACINDEQENIYSV